MNLLVTGAWKQAEEYLKTLEDMGLQVCFLKNENDELPCNYDWVEAVICNNLFMYHPIEQFGNLTYIQVTSAGMDRLPLDYIRNKGIELHNAKGVYSVPMSEFVLGSVLNIYKELAYYRDNQKQHRWCKRYELRELTDKEVYIIGCGDVGVECAKRFKAFGCHVTGLNKTVMEKPFFDEIKPLSELNEELSKADIIVISIALTEDTVHIIDWDSLKKLRENTIIINISRGSIVNTEDLIRCVRENRIYAVLDVFDNEPLNSASELWDMDRLYITPHSSYIGDHNNERIFRVIVDNLRNRMF